MYELQQMTLYAELMFVRYGNSDEVYSRCFWMLLVLLLLLMMLLSYTVVAAVRLFFVSSNSKLRAV
jgi:hypothetical protein